MHLLHQFLLCPDCDASLWNTLGLSCKGGKTWLLTRTSRNDHYVAWAQDSELPETTSVDFLVRAFQVHSTQRSIFWLISISSFPIIIVFVLSSWFSSLHTLTEATEQMQLHEKQTLMAWKVLVTYKWINRLASQIGNTNGQLFHSGHCTAYIIQPCLYEFLLRCRLESGNESLVLLGEEKFEDCVWWFACQETLEPSSSIYPGSILVVLFRYTCLKHFQ